MSEVDLLKDRAALAAHAIAAAYPYRAALPAADTTALREQLTVVLTEAVKDLYAYYNFRAHQNAPTLH